MRLRNTKLKLEQDKKKRLIRRIIKRGVFFIFAICVVSILSIQFWKFAGASIYVVSKDFLTENFTIKELVIIGASDYSEKEIKSFVSPLLKANSNLLSFPLGSIKDFLSTRSYLSKASVRKELPSRIVVNVTEKKTMALLMRNGYYLVDENGEIIRPMSIGENLDFPVITVEDKMSEKKLDEDLKIVCSLIQLDARSMPYLAPSEFRITNDSIILKSMDLKNKENVMPPIYFGKEGIERSVLYIKKLWPELVQKKDGIEFIDGRGRDGVVVKSKTFEDRQNG